MADVFTVAFEFMSLALHIGSQVVYFLCTLVNLNHELIAASLWALLRLLGTLQAILHGVIVAFADVVIYVVEIATRLIFFVSRLYNGATTAFEASWEISQFIAYSAYTLLVYALKTSIVLASWTFHFSVRLFTMLLDSVPLLMTKCADLFHDISKAVPNFWQKGEQVVAVTVRQTQHISEMCQSILLGCCNTLLTPFVELRNFIIDDVVGIVFKYKFELFLFFLSLCISGIIMLSHKYLLTLGNCFYRFINFSVQMIGSVFASQFSNNELRNNNNDDIADPDDDDDRNDSSEDESRESDNESDHNDLVSSQSEADSDNESDEALEGHIGARTDWLGLHEQNGRAHIHVRAMNRTRNTFGIGRNDVENINFPGPSSYNLRSTRRTPDRACPGRQFRTLKRELEEEKDRRLCVICQDKEKNVVVLPCKHMCMCEECADEVLHNEYLDRRLCPLCRTRINKAINVYL